MASKSNGSVGAALFWMLLLSILLIWLPGIGPFVAGFVGGRKAGNFKNAFLAFLVPAILFTVAIFLLPGFPVFSVVLAMAALPMFFIYNVTLFLGAIVGVLTVS